MDVLTKIKNPTWNIDMSLYSTDKGTVKIYNRTFHTCNMKETARKNPFVAGFVRLVKAQTNFTLGCPLTPNIYHVCVIYADVVNQITFRPFYVPNTLAFFKFHFYDQIPIGNLTLIAFYKLGVIIKRIC